MILILVSQSFQNDSINKRNIISFTLGLYLPVLNFKLHYNNCSKSFWFIFDTYSVHVPLSSVYITISDPSALAPFFCLPNLRHPRELPWGGPCQHLRLSAHKEESQASHWECDDDEWPVSPENPLSQSSYTQVCNFSAIRKFDICIILKWLTSTVLRWWTCLILYFVSGFVVLVFYQSLPQQINHELVCPFLLHPLQ